MSLHRSPEPEEPWGIRDLDDAGAHVLWRDRDAEVRDFVAAERRVTNLAARLAVASEPIRVDAAGCSLRGSVLACVDGFIVLGDAVSALVSAVVAVRAVTGVYNLPIRMMCAIPRSTDLVPSVVSSAAHWFGQLVGTRIHVVVRDGRQDAGVLRHVWADHLDVDYTGGRAAIPLSALHAVVAADV